MTFTRADLTFNLENGNNTMCIMVAQPEETLYIPIEIKMASKNPSSEYATLYEFNKFMFPTYKEVIIW